MVKPYLEKASFAFGIACLAGCANLSSPIAEPLSSAGHTNTSGSHQFFKEESFERIYLPSLLDPDRKREQIRQPRAATSGATTPSEPSEAKEAVELDEAFSAFYSYPPADLKERRNRVQDRVLAASEQRCNVFKNYLRRVDTFQETATGILATIFGGAGAIATGVSRARTLSALGGITSGIGAELKQGYFSNIATQIIVPGIDLARSEIQRDILSKRSQLTSTYTVEAALQDAARYHGACSLNSGLERAGVAVKEIQNPGIVAFNHYMGQMNLSGKLVRRMNDENVKITDEDYRLANYVTGAATVTVLSDQLSVGSYADRYIFAVSDAKDKLASLETAIETKISANAVEAKKGNEDISDRKTIQKKEDCGTLKQEKDRCEANFALENLKGAYLGSLNSKLTAKLDTTRIQEVRALDEAIIKKSAEAAAASGAARDKKLHEVDIERALRDVDFKSQTAKFGPFADEIGRALTNVRQFKSAEDLESNLKSIERILQ